MGRSVHPSSLEVDGIFDTLTESLFPNFLYTALPQSYRRQFAGNNLNRRAKMGNPAAVLKKKREKRRKKLEKRLEDAKKKK